MERDVSEFDVPDVHGVTWYGVTDGDTLRFGDLPVEGMVRVELPGAFPDATYYRVMMCDADVLVDAPDPVMLEFDIDCVRRGRDQVVVLALIIPAHRRAATLARRRVKEALPVPGSPGTAGIPAPCLAWKP